jgi:hypothetical protein
MVDAALLAHDDTAARRMVPAAVLLKVRTN